MTNHGDHSDHSDHGDHGDQDRSHADDGRDDNQERQRPGPDRNAVAHAAAAAPSIHNAAPWLLRVDSDEVQLYRDSDRILPVTDPDGREATLSCGAALFGVRLAVAMAGREPQVRFVPDPSDRLATVAAGRERGPSADDERLFEALPRRGSSPGAFVPCAVPEHVVAELEVACRAEGVWVREIRRPEHRRLLADLSARAAGILATDDGPSDAWRPAGPGSTLPGMRGALLLHAEAADVDIEHDLLLAVGTCGDTSHDWLRAGQALHRLLLRATVRGLAASTFTHVVEVPQLRQLLSTELRLPDPPQFLVRLGYPTSQVRRPPQRSLEDVLLG